jgi:dihydropteroate synthase
LTGALHLTCGPHRLDLSRPRVMGIVNITPDSFASGGAHFDHEVALAYARQLRADGADIIDVGGESTRPGSRRVTEKDELARVLPVIEALAADGAIVSVDTMKPGVMRAATAAGATMINDVRALQGRGALEAAAAAKAAVCLMHMQGEPRTMQKAPHYEDVVREVRDFLVARALVCEGTGIAHDSIAIDPGFGFGKTMAHNLALVRALDVFAATGYPVLMGMSRKGTLGDITGRAAGDRLAGSVAAALAAAARGALILRVHDVRETVDALKVWLAITGPDAGGADTAGT